MSSRRVLTLFLFSSAFLFADNASTISPVFTVLENIKIQVGLVLGLIVAIKLIPLAWKYVKPIISHNGSMVSSEQSRKEAMARLEAHGFGEKELNLRSYRDGIKAEKFRKKYRSFEDWVDTDDYRKNT